MTVTAEKKAARVARAKAHVRDGRLRVNRSSTEGRDFPVECDALDITGLHAAKQIAHAIVAEHDGTPRWLEELRESIFIGVPEDEKERWHVDVAEALPVGVDIDPAKHAIAIIWMRHQLKLRETWPECVRDEVCAVIDMAIAYHAAPSKGLQVAAATAAAAALKRMERGRDDYDISPEFYAYDSACEACANASEIVAEPIEWNFTCAVIAKDVLAVLRGMGGRGEA